MLAFRYFSTIPNPVAKVSYCKVLNGLFAIVRKCTTDKYPAQSAPEHEEHELQEKPKNPPHLKFGTNSSDGFTQPEKNSIEGAAEIFSEQWKDLDEISRKKVSDDYHRKLEDYLKQLREHFVSLKRIPVKKSKITRPRRQGRPVVPGSTFALFWSDERKINEPFGKNVLRQISERWKSLTDEEKAKYIEKRRLAVEEYKIKVAEWEQEMIRQGKEHLVKKSPLKISKREKSKKQRDKIVESSVFRGLTDVT